MEDPIAADLLPSLYRRVLDNVARLERVDEREAAFRIRRHATAVYSTRWDDYGRRAMEGLDREAREILATRTRAAGTALQRRPTPS